MINQFLKISMLVVTGRFLKPRLRALLLLAAVWFTITWLHGEYVDYVSLSGDTRFYLYASLIKLVAYVLAFLSYFLLVERRILLASRTPKRNARKRMNIAKAFSSTPSGPSNLLTPPNPSASSTSPASSNLPVAQPGDDGFDFLRHKRKLESSTDKILQRPSGSQEP